MSKQSDNRIPMNKSVPTPQTLSGSQKFHKYWLKISALVVASFGPIFFLGTMVATMEPARFTLDLISWPLDGQTTYASPDTRFLSALAGGFLMGWGVMVWCLSEWVYDYAPEMVRRAVLYSFLAWYIVDSTGSVLSGNASNAFFNILVLLLGVGPLWRPAQS